MQPTSAGAKNFLEPEKIAAYFGLEKGDHIAEFGAGHGYFTIPMARTVGGDGKVYAVDIQKAALEVVRAKAKLEHLLNVELVWGDVERAGGSKLKDNFIDFVLISNVLFQVENRPVVFAEARRVLRAGGRLALIEWDESMTPLGPPAALRVSKAQALVFARAAGFELDHEFEAGSHHYGLLFVKK